MSSSTEDLESLPTEELRRRAFHVAERRADIGFFWDLLRHLPASADVQAEDGSPGGIGEGLADTIALVRELFGMDLGGSEPLLRARFIDYLRTHAG